MRTSVRSILITLVLLVTFSSLAAVAEGIEPDPIVKPEPLTFTDDIRNLFLVESVLLDAIGNKSELSDFLEDEGYTSYEAYALSNGHSGPLLRFLTSPTVLSPVGQIAVRKTLKVYQEAGENFLSKSREIVAYCTISTVTDEFRDKCILSLMDGFLDFFKGEVEEAFKGYNASFNAKLRKLNMDITMRVVNLNLE